MYTGIAKPPSLNLQCFCNPYEFGSGSALMTHEKYLFYNDPFTMFVYLSI